MIGKNQLIGEEDCAANDTYHTSVVCVSLNATLLAMPRADFRKIEQQSSNWQAILQQVEAKVRSNNLKLITTMQARGHVAENLVVSELMAQNERKNCFVAGADLLKQQRQFRKEQDPEKAVFVQLT